MTNDQQDTYANPALKEWYRERSTIGLASFSEASASAEIIFNCTSGHESLSALKQAGEENLAGKVLIDVANPLDFSNGMPPSLNPVNTTSLGEQIQQNFPKAKVVKALNTMNAGLMVNPSKVQGEHNVFICGDDETAKNKTKEILNEFGWNNNQVINLGEFQMQGEQRCYYLSG